MTVENPADTPPAEVPAPPANRARFLGDEDVLAVAAARRGIAAGDARHLSLLAGNRRAPLALEPHRDRGRLSGIHRDGARASARLPHRDRAAGADQYRAFPHDLEQRLARAGRRSADAGRARPARAIRGLPRAALSPDPHALSRHPLPPERRGLALRHLRDLLVGHDRSHARARLSVGAGEPRAVQAAQHALWRPSRRVRRIRHPPVLPRRAAGSSWSVHSCSAFSWPSATSTGTRSPRRAGAAATTS